MRVRRLARWVPALASVAVLCTSCATAAGGAPLPPRPRIVVVDMREYRFDYNHFIPGGRVVFEARNRGTVAHQITLAPLTEDFPPIDVQLHGTERRFLQPFAGTPDVPPGGSWTFAVDLAPGTRYALLCFDQDPDGQVHALKGMNSEFRTPAAPGQTIPTNAPTSSGATTTPSTTPRAPGGTP